MTTLNLDPRDEAAIDRMHAVEPEWRELKTAAQAIGLARPLLLHAGPPFASPRDITAPILNSAVIAALFEGWAKDFDAAEKMILAGELQLRPAQDHGVVTPLAAVVSPTQLLQVVVDRREPSRIAHGPINGGSGPAMRLGLREQRVLDHVRWLNGDLAEVLGRSLGEPIPLIAIADAALAQGDDCHGRTPAATRGLVERLARHFGGDDKAKRAKEFLDASPSFFLNIWMAATKCMMRAAEGVAGASVVTAAGGNGRDFGLKLGGLPTRWFTVAAEPPSGAVAEPGMMADRLGAIGDSAVVDAMGLGAMALAHAPETAKALQGYLPADALDLPARLLAKQHAGFRAARVRLGLAARLVAASGVTPIVSLGIIDKTGRRGRLGGGVYRPPAAPFVAAVKALEQES